MRDLFSLQDKVAVITGGSGFLGSQYRRALEEYGAEVVNWDIDTGVNIADEESVRRAKDLVISRLGKVDILINNAAFNPQVGESSSDDNWAPYERFSIELWRRELEVNLTAQMIVTQAIAPAMKEQRSGSIIFVASDLAFIGPQNSIYEPSRFVDAMCVTPRKFKDIAYITSKAGILGLTRTWAAYLGPYNVRANALVPGGMQRQQDPEFVSRNSLLNMLGRMAQEGEYNGPMIFLASDASSYMTGACLIVDGGRTAW